MVEITQRDIDAIHDTHDKVIRLETLIGNGDNGLCRDIKCHQKRITRIELVIAGLIGSGVLTGSVIGLINLLGG